MDNKRKICLPGESRDAQQLGFGGFPSLHLCLPRLLQFANGCCMDDSRKGFVDDGDAYMGDDGYDDDGEKEGKAKDMVLNTQKMG
ncbi:hypothetical protein K1719_032203 [Acacia pycnantha]|nr:hypothetical protein K1719_032203 [Acacia pycnantha]